MHDSKELDRIGESLMTWQRSNQVMLSKAFYCVRIQQVPESGESVRSKGSDAHVCVHAELAVQPSVTNNIVTTNIINNNNNNNNNDGGGGNRGGNNGDDRWWGNSIWRSVGVPVLGVWGGGWGGDYGGGTWGNGESSLPGLMLCV